jgi:hypothetical protein
MLGGCGATRRHPVRYVLALAEVLVLKKELTGLAHARR